MITVNGTEIKMTRGDTLRVQISIQRDGEDYTPVEGDEVTFFLKHSTMNSDKTAYTDENPLVTKTAPIETMILTLDPADTKQLEFGKYVYDLQITFADGSVDTFINNAKFVLVPEVG